ncbi:MAG: integrase family protein [bacterium]
MPKLTKTSVEDAAATSKEFLLWDTDLKGFGLRVKPSGVKTYLIQYRDAQGRSKRLTIGQHGPLTCDEARKAAKTLLAKVTLRSDPAAQRKADREEPTVEEFCGAYLLAVESGALQTRRGKSKASITLAVDRGRIRNHILPILGKKLVRDLTRSDVLALLSGVTMGKTAKSLPSEKLRGRVEVQGGKGTAKKAVQLLGAILAYAADTGVIAQNPVRGVKLPKDNRRVVDDPEGMLRALGKALALAEANDENATAVMMIRLAALTGMRSGEVVQLKLGELDFQRNAIRLAVSKTGKSVRPLNSCARELLIRDWRNSRGDRVTGFMFPAERGDGHYGGLPGAVVRIKAAPYLDQATRDALAGFSMHIARHLFASIANLVGVGEITLAALLGHSKGSVTSGYVSHIDQHLLAQANKAASSVASLLNRGAAAGRSQGAQVSEPFGLAYDDQIDAGNVIELPQIVENW